MQLGEPVSARSPPFAPSPTRSYLHHSLLPPGVDPTDVPNKMFYTYVPNTIKTRKRTTPAQLEILEGVFLTDKKPNAPKRKDLAKELKMSPREVQVWFQNRRAKEKKSNARTDPSSSSPASQAPSASAVSPSSDAAPDSATDVPPSSSSSASPITKFEPQTPEPSPRAHHAPSASWQPALSPTPLVTDSLGPTHPVHSPPDASPAAYELRRNSLPVLNLPPQPAHASFNPHHQQMPHRHHPPPRPSRLPFSLRRCCNTAAPRARSRSTRTHFDFIPPAPPVHHHQMLHPPAPHMRASISEGMGMPSSLPTGRVASAHAAPPTRFHPFQQTQPRRPNFGHRPSAPAIFHASAPPLPPLPPTPTATDHQQEMFTQDFSWHNPDPFGPAPETGYSFGMPPPVPATGILPTGDYEFPARRPGASALPRRSGGSLISLYGATSDASSSGPYFSDVASDAGDDSGRRGSCVSTSERFGALSVGDAPGPPTHPSTPSVGGGGSDGYASEHGTVTYPSPASDSERGGAPGGGSSELAGALADGRDVVGPPFALLGTGAAPKFPPPQDPALPPSPYEGYAAAQAQYGYSVGVGVAYAEGGGVGYAPEDAYGVGYT
ncbi:hypothetical protein BC834DRAFT_1035135 [Gloeopeniophorella convolvens]|nr:hypothetical protein BC834DRAFT_1035135 [Gloeopeniophorella convolvens]